MSLDIAAIQARLGAAFTLRHSAELASTNDAAMALARGGAPGGIIISTDFQTAGRGRRGHVWTAPAGSSVLMSLLVRPVQVSPAHLAVLTGVGVAHGLRALDAPARIKWPNDIIIADCKVAGILVETVGDAAVIGVGVNCLVNDFPAELRSRAGSLHALLGRPIAREDVLVAVARGLADTLARAVDDFDGILAQWRAWNWLQDRPVRVTDGERTVLGSGLTLSGPELAISVTTAGGTVRMPLVSTIDVL